MTPTLKLVTVVVIAVALGCSGYVLVNPQGAVVLWFRRYAAYLERKLRIMFVFGKGTMIARAHVAGVTVLVAYWLVFGLAYWYAIIPLAIILPNMLISRKLRARTEKIDAQVEGFLIALANALKSTPSVSDAFMSLRDLVAAPLRDEIELAAKEIRVGSTLDQALLNMASRVGSPRLDSGLSAVLIGRQVGGNLPAILETTAEAMREMQRLDGVVRAKTAEGKFQAIVLALVPFVLIGGLLYFEPTYFDSLADSVMGFVMVVLAGGLWIASILIARRILAVNV